MQLKTFDWLKSIISYNKLYHLFMIIISFWLVCVELILIILITNCYNYLWYLFCIITIHLFFFRRRTLQKSNYDNHHIIPKKWTMKANSYCWTNISYHKLFIKLPIVFPYTCMCVRVYVYICMFSQLRL